MIISWEETLKNIYACQNCPLYQGITNKVPGCGNPHADVMIIGEAPGYYEDKQGLPFVGNAGNLLNKMLLSIGLQREEVYIANALKCRPDNNRTPSLSEIYACKQHLRCQFALIKPKISLLMGTTAVKTVLGDDEIISRCRGKVIEKGGALFVATYHPAALLRDESKKRFAYDDLLIFKSKLSELKEFENMQ